MKKRLTIVALAAAAAALCPTLLRAAVTHPEDYGCSAYDEGDDTACWQAAIDAAHHPSSSNEFGTVEADPLGRYYISDTLCVMAVEGGLIDGKGAELKWIHNPSPTSKCGRPMTTERPMWLLSDTHSLRIQNMRIVSSDVNPLKAAFEFTNGPATYPAPTGNVIDHVDVEGSNLHGLDYGVMFTIGAGGDFNNDQSTISDTTFNSVTKAAISIQGQNSMNHRFYAVNAYGACGNETVDTDDRFYTSGSACGAPVDTDQAIKGASFVRLKGGNFQSIGGFRANMGNAEFYLELVNTPVVIIDSTSELCARFIRTGDSNTNFPFDVSVYGGRFSTKPSTPPQCTSPTLDPRVIRWNRFGSLTVRGLAISGPPPTGVQPYVCLSPSPTPPPPADKGRFEIAYTHFVMDNSKTWNVVQANQNAIVSSEGNYCADPVTLGMAPCIGLAAGNVPMPLTFEGATLNGITTSLALQEPTSTSKTITLPDATGTVILNTAVDTTAEVNLLVGDDDFATLNGIQTLKNKTLQDATNVFPALGLLSFQGAGPGMGDDFFGPGGAVDPSTEANVQALMPAMTARKLVCRSSAVLTGTKAWNVYLRRGTVTPLDVLGPCTLNSTQQTCSVSGSVTYNGTTELLSVRINGSNNPSGKVLCTTTVGF